MRFVRASNMGLRAAMKLAFLAAGLGASTLACDAANAVVGDVCAPGLTVCGDRCVDLGSSPGGWTWALERLGARVISVDKAPIDERLTRLTRVRYLKDSAFAVEPTKVGRVDWLVSDVICYPARIVKLVQRWHEAHPRAGFVITIKFQGKTDMDPLRELAPIAGGRLVHLSHNKHELTWLRPPPDDGEGAGPDGPETETVTETEDE